MHLTKHCYKAARVEMWNLRLVADSLGLTFVVLSCFVKECLYLLGRSLNTVSFDDFNQIPITLQAGRPTQLLHAPPSWLQLHPLSPPPFTQMGSILWYCYSSWPSTRKIALIQRLLASMTCSSSTPTPFLMPFVLLKGAPFSDCKGMVVERQRTVQQKEIRSTKRRHITQFVEDFLRDPVRSLAPRWWHKDLVSRRPPH